MRSVGSAELFELRQAFRWTGGVWQSRKEEDDEEDEDSGGPTVGVPVLIRTNKNKACWRSTRVLCSTAVWSTPSRSASENPMAAYVTFFLHTDAVHEPKQSDCLIVQGARRTGSEWEVAGSWRPRRDTRLVRAPCTTRRPSRELALF